MVKNTTSIVRAIVILAFICGIVSCSTNINRINDPHFDQDGHYLDSLGDYFTAVKPTSIDFYIEVSGSMNGFFRANKPTAFKTDVWAIVSNFGNNDIYVPSNSATSATKYNIEQFKQKMSSGGFVSTIATQVPAMLENILSNLDYESGAVAVLISDMKYSPVGNKAMNVLLDLYATDIRNIVGKYPGVAFSVIGAYSDYLDVRGNSVCDKSPYYYVVIGKDVCVAEVRNSISIILSKRGNYLDNIEIGFDYKRPAYAFGAHDNVIKMNDEPTFYNYDASYSDTCVVTLKIDLSDFRWLIASDEEILRNNLSIKALYGSDVKVDNIEIIADNHYQKELKRRAIASVELKLWNMPMEADVVEWTLNHPDKQLSEAFMAIMEAKSEDDLNGTFSLFNFIQGVFQAVQNHWNQEPNRILISKM